MSWLWRFQLAWSFLLIVIWTGFVFATPMDPNYTAGELLDHVSAWLSAQPLYAPLDSAPYRVLNYPPLYLWGVKLLSYTGMSPLAAGRMLNVMAFAFLLLVLFRWLRSQNCDAQGALIILSLVATSFPLLFSLGQLHMELSAIAVYLYGCYLVRRPGPIYKAILAGGLIALACFIKQTQVVLSLIPILWLLCYDRRKFLFSCLGYAVFGLVGVAWLHSVFGAEIWRHVITYTVGMYSLPNLVKQLIWHVLPWSVFGGLGVFLIVTKVIARSDLRTWLFIGHSIWLLSAARMGSSYQYFIAWSAVTLLCVGPWLVAWWRDCDIQPVPMRRWVVTLLLLLQIIGGDVGVATVLAYDAKTLQDEARHLSRLCRHLGSRPEMIVVEAAGLARACGRAAAWHPFIMTSLARQGLWDPEPFILELEEKQYPAIVLPFDPEGPVTGVHEERWLGEVLMAIRLNYRLSVQVDGWYVLEPL